MKRILLLCLAVFGLAMCALAHPVNLETATTIASHFMGTHDLQLTATYRTDNGIAAFYVFNTTDGFVIVSADDCETPVIGYSHEGHFDPDNVPVQMEGYLQDFVTRIQYGIENHIEADEVTKRQWQLVKTIGRLNDDKSSKAVGPLLTEKWHQGCLYNTFCPTMSGPCGRAEAGCVAVAMGQIMHYWGYPATGWGSQSYFNAGTMLSADFGSTTYDWDHMPDSLTDASSEAEVESVATLLFHCGVSVKMSYTINGSGAESQDVPDALIRNFNYSRHLHREKKSNDNVQWLIMLKNNLDLQRPIYYSGKGDAGHAFVCDGYDNNDLLHFNWGWGGNADGYFSLGNLNPNGYDFSNNNYAIFDIFPQYEPCIVTATVYPPTSGSIEGAGEYHIGEQCTLTATPSDNYEFFCWKKDGQIISNSPSITLDIEDDANMEANFTLLPVSQITTGSPLDASMSLSWNRNNTEWKLLKKFDVYGEVGGLATDGRHIYVTYPTWNDPPFMFGKYTMDGELVEMFNLEGIPDALCLAYDGTNYYCNSLNSTNYLSVLYTIDLDNKTIVDSTDMGRWFGALTYDPDHDGFWLTRDYYTTLHDRQGTIIQNSPTAPYELYGSGYHTANDGSHHLLLLLETLHTKGYNAGVYDYDIDNNIIYEHPLLSYGGEGESCLGAHAGKYHGKDALFMVIDNYLHIYEINSPLAQITGYRIYRSNAENNIVMLSEEVDGLSYVDDTWKDAPNGEYRFGISSVYANGVESEIVWSDTIAKTNYDIEEYEKQMSSSVQKVLENGHVVILKDGKKYSILGQEIK